MHEGSSHMVDSGSAWNYDMSALFCSFNSTTRGCITRRELRGNEVLVEMYVPTNDLAWAARWAWEIGRGSTALRHRLRHRRGIFRYQPSRAGSGVQTKPIHSKRANSDSTAESYDPGLRVSSQENAWKNTGSASGQRACRWAGAVGCVATWGM